MGRQSTGGYSIDIVNIEYDGDEMIITVRETCPAATDMVTEAITYPGCKVFLTEIPDHLRVVNEAGEDFCITNMNLNEYKELTDDWIKVYENLADGKYYRTYVYETEDGRYKYYNVLITIRFYFVGTLGFAIKDMGYADTEEEILEIAEEFGSNGTVFYHGDELPQPAANVYAVG